MLFQIEEKVRQIVREKRPIQTLEMMPVSARELLLKERRHVQAKKLERQKGLVYVAQIGSFYDWISGPLLKNTMQLGACKILSLELLEGQRLRIVGVARESKAELKDFLKRWDAYPKTRHEVIGEKKGFWQVRSGGILWLPRGLEVRQKLIDFLKKQLDTYWIERPVGVGWEEFGERVGEISVDNSSYDAEKGLFEDGRQTVLRIAVRSEGATKSLLQTIRKTLMMLGFSFDEKVEANFLMEDRLGRPWAAASFEKGVASISVERNLALLIEKDHCKGTIFEN